MYIQHHVSRWDRIRYNMDPVRCPAQNLAVLGRCGDNSELVRDSTKPSDLLMESQNLRTRWATERRPASQEIPYGWKYRLYVFKKRRYCNTLYHAVLQIRDVIRNPDPDFFPFRTSDLGSNNNNNRSKKINYSCRSLKRVPDLGHCIVS